MSAAVPDDAVVPDVVVRVRDAALSQESGRVHVVITGDLDLAALGDQVANGGGRAQVVAGRLDVLVAADRLRDAAGRLGGRLLADAVGNALDAAVGAWHHGPVELSTVRGDLQLGNRPAVMGIVNVTPDSFSDGGQHDTTAAALAHSRSLLTQGADLLDIGGESTRPGASIVSEDEELSRVVPVVTALADEGVLVSIDTTKAAVAAAAVAAGAAIVNDVSAGTADDAMLTTVAGLRVPYVAMHAQGTPRDMQDDPHYEDVVAEVFEYLAHARQRCLDAGIAAANLVVDPGFGFGKTTAHNLDLLRHLSDFRSLGHPVLVGASRKSFLGAVSGVAVPAERVAASVAAAVLAVNAGASILRVHDVQATVEALRVASSVRLGEPVQWQREDSLEAARTKDKGRT